MRAGSRIQTQRRTNGTPRSRRASALNFRSAVAQYPMHLHCPAIPARLLDLLGGHLGPHRGKRGRGRIGGDGGSRGRRSGWNALLLLHLRGPLRQGPRRRGRSLAHSAPPRANPACGPPGLVKSHRYLHRCLCFNLHPATAWFHSPGRRMRPGRGNRSVIAERGARSCPISIRCR